jgi:hypothetical protein
MEYWSGGVTEWWGSARVSRAGDGVLAIANFSLFGPTGYRAMSHPTPIKPKVRCGGTPQPTRETRALPGNVASGRKHT